MNLKYTILCFFFVCSSIAGLPNESITPQESQTDAVKTFDQYIIIRMYVQRPILSITLRHFTPQGEDNDSQVIRYVPNTLAHWGISLSWEGFGFSCGFDSPKSEKDESIYGNTRYFDFQISFYGKNFGCDAYYQNYKGFYLLQPEKYGYHAGSAEALRPDIAAKTIGANIFLSFFEEFSFSAAFDQSQRQISTAFSPVAMISLNGFTIESNRSIIVPSQETYYGTFSGYTGGSYIGISASPGCALTYVWGTCWYFSSVIFVGSGLMHKEYTTNDGNVVENKPFGKANLRASCGYNDDELFGGIQASFDFTASERTFRRNINEEMTEVITTAGNIEIFFGIRF